LQSINSKTKSIKSKVSQKSKAKSHDKIENVEIKIEPVCHDIENMELATKPEDIFGQQRDTTGDALLDAAKSGVMTKENF
jgi:hypothetical protein